MRSELPDFRPWSAGPGLADRNLADSKTAVGVYLASMQIDPLIENHFHIDQSTLQYVLYPYCRRWIGRIADIL